MDSNPPPDRPGFGPGSPGYGPGGQPPPEGPQSPAPGPQSPVPGEPQSPAPPPYSPPAPPPGPESPGAPPVPGYGGPVPPGGWQQPPAAPSHGGTRAPLASWGSRLGAYLIDGLIVSVPALILVLVLLGGAIGAGGDDDDVALAGAILGIIGVFLVFLVVTLLYAPLLMIRSGEHNGQTWGKQLIGIRAVQDNGQPWTFWPAVVREVLLKNLAVGVASFVIPLLPWFLNFFWPLWDDQNRALHDMAASSHVVKA
jgi:uncharacterized RDD family membrane protein YckC